jgi:hypothetical protein
MAAQKGFIYETNAYKALKSYGISAGTGAAGASSDRPDLEIKLSKDPDNKSEGCELKISPTAAGSLVMKYTDGKWGFGEYSDDPEKKLLYELGKKYKLLENMNRSGSAGSNWRGKVPHLQNDNRGKKILVGAKDKRVAYEKDIKQFGGQNEVHIDIPASAICDYYNTKYCSYINVGTHGFYTLNGKDPLKLNIKITRGSSIPDFGQSASARIRVRCQYKGGGDYQFVMTLEFSNVSKSPYNLAPTSTATSVNIDKKKLESAENIPLLEAFRK